MFSFTEDQAHEKTMCSIVVSPAHVAKINMLSTSLKVKTAKFTGYY